MFASTARDFIEKAIRATRTSSQPSTRSAIAPPSSAAWSERASGARSEVGSFEPNYEGSSIVWGPAGERRSAIGSHPLAARAGHHLSPQPLSCGRNVFDELGDGFTLLDFGSDGGASSSFATAAAELGIPLKVITDTAAGGHEKYQASLVLVRPDQFVAWAGEKADADEVLRRATGRS